MKSKMRVIVDCDAGADDAMALFLLLAGDANKEIDILAVTCVSGNTGVQNVKINVLRTLQAANRLDIPVFVGADGPLIPPAPTGETSPGYYGYDGFGDADLPDVPDVSLIKGENAIEYLNRITNEKKGQISLICLGPLTNVALAIRTYKQFAQNLKDIFIMGGNYRGVGNSTSAAEFNFYFDPEAAQIVLSSIQCPITIVPWEASLETRLSLEWRFEVLGKLTTPQVQLLNTVERSLHQKKKKKPTQWSASDSLVVAVFLRPSLISKSHKCHLSVELHGHGTRGQAIVDHLQKNDHNSTIIESVNCDMFKELLLWAAGMECFK
ncbi:hypothetical protein R5R35_007008 [Gryllus longicercus]|uniref:Inosine/uridine-preferring nucleoside hydrolase domain-containing protein n=1 Tax=Gryllus longicercus TaxID=2509291 RepID=A0AAN9W289_9ORTH